MFCFHSCWDIFPCLIHQKVTAQVYLTNSSLVDSFCVNKIQKMCKTGCRFLLLNYFKRNVVNVFFSCQQPCELFKVLFVLQRNTIEPSAAKGLGDRISRWFSIHGLRGSFSAQKLESQTRVKQLNPNTPSLPLLLLLSHQQRDFSDPNTCCAQLF